MKFYNKLKATKSPPAAVAAQAKMAVRAFSQPTIPAAPARAATDSSRSAIRRLRFRMRQSSWRHGARPIFPQFPSRPTSSMPATPNRPISTPCTAMPQIRSTSAKRASRPASAATANLPSQGSLRAEFIMSRLSRIMETRQTMFRPRL